MKTNNVTDPIVPTTQASYFKLLIACIVIGPFIVIGLIWLANYALPPEDAKTFKAPLFALWGIVGTFASYGSVKGALERLKGQITTQKETALMAAECEPAAPGYVVQFEDIKMPERAPITEDSEGGGPQDDDDEN